MSGDANMTRETLEDLIGRMLDAETRNAPPPVGEEGDWLYGSAGFTEPDEHGWMAPLPSAHVLDAAGAGVLAYGNADGCAGERGAAVRSAPFAGTLAGDRGGDRPADGSRGMSDQGGGHPLRRRRWSGRSRFPIPRRLNGICSGRSSRDSRITPMPTNSMAPHGSFGRKWYRTSWRPGSRSTPGVVGRSDRSSPWR